MLAHYTPKVMCVGGKFPISMCTAGDANYEQQARAK